MNLLPNPPYLPTPWHMKSTHVSKGRQNWFQVVCLRENENRPCYNTACLFVIPMNSCIIGRKRSVERWSCGGSRVFFPRQRELKWWGKNWDIYQARAPDSVGRQTTLSTPSHNWKPVPAQHSRPRRKPAWPSLDSCPLPGRFRLSREELGIVILNALVMKLHRFSVDCLTAMLPITLFLVSILQIHVAHTHDKTDPPIIS